MQNLSRRFQLLLVLIAVLFAQSCNKAETVVPSPSTLPQRVIALSPSLTEIAYAVGAGESVVGISQYAVFPPEALDKPKCGGYFDPNYETILALQPDLILMQGRHQEVRDFCQANNLRIAEFKIDTIADIQSAIRQAGQLFGQEKRAEEICANITAELESLKVELPRSQWPKVFICPDRQTGSMANMMTAGQGSFLDEMIEAAGGVNIFGELAMLYPTISKESLLARAPDVILELRPSEKIDERKAAKLRTEWQPLSLLPAVKEGRIRIITDDAILIPTPRIAESVRRLHKAIYQDWEGKQP